MFEKRATYKLVDAETIGVPAFITTAANSPDSFIREQIIPDPKLVQITIEKIAEATKKSSEEKSGDGEEKPAFDLQAEIEGHPDSLFIKCFAIKADETNDNGDFFSREELIKATPTFVGVPLFTNHSNADINEARGKVVHSWWDDAQNGIMIVGRVDAEAYPQLARGIKEEYVVGCFPADAPVLMADGTEKSICDVEDGDEVISHTGNSRKVLGTRQRKYKFPLYSIKLEGIDQPLICTSGHHLMVYRMQDMCSCGCGAELSIRQDTRITASRFNRKFKHGHNMRGENIAHTPVKKLRACDLKEDDFLFEPKILDESCDDYVTNDEAFLIGLFMAEGSYEKRKGKRLAVLFSFDYKELETLAFRCEELLAKVFKDFRNKPTVTAYPEASQSRISLYGKEIAEWFFERCGEYSDKKSLNNKLLRLGADKTSSLLAGYIEGDGYNVKGKSYGAATVSEKFASQLRILFQKIGIRNRYRVRDNENCKTAWGYKPVYEITCGLTTAENLKNHLIYKKANDPCVNAAEWHSLDDKTLRRIVEIKEIPFDGVVYDIEVEEDHSYCVNHIAVSNTSMGCQVQYSICSVCHNYAETPDQYCSCIRERKTRMVQAKNQLCKYHERGDESECPICGSKKSEKKKYAVSTKVFEYNYGIKFIENSFVVNPACPTCGVTEIIDPQKFRTKVAAIQKVLPRLLKTAGEHSVSCTDHSCEIIDIHKFHAKVVSIEKVLPELLKAARVHPLTCTDHSCIKIGGQQELDSLNQALDMLSSVSQSMLTQKEQIDLEFLSDLVSVLADLQTVTDELTEQGYGRLQSPGQPPIPGENPEEIQQGAPEVTNAAEPLKPTPGGGSKVRSGPAGQVGNVTGPLASTRKINLEKVAKDIIRKGKTIKMPHLNIPLKEKCASENIDPSEAKQTIKIAFSLPQTTS